jgi:hypothetical protein
MKMLPAIPLIVYVLITGASAFKHGVLADLPVLRQFFQMTVDGRLPNGGSLILKILYDLTHRNMAIPQRRHVVKNKTPLLGVITCRTIVFHTGGSVPKKRNFVNMKTEIIFIFMIPQNGTHLGERFSHNVKYYPQKTRRGSGLNFSFFMNIRILILTPRFNGAFANGRGRFT